MISVEYILPQTQGQKDAYAFLDGQLGEVEELAYRQAVKRAAKGASDYDVTVSVKFPLIVPPVEALYYPSEVISKGLGLRLPVKHLRESRRTPLSRFTKQSWPEDLELLLDCFEKPVFFETASQDSFLLAAKKVASLLPKAWVWYVEKRSVTNKKSNPVVFLGARFYGADRLVPIYAPNRFFGMAIQVFTRELLNSYSKRLLTDVFLFANTEEYVTSIDGVELPREKISSHLAMDFLYGPQNAINARLAQQALREKNLKQFQAGA